MTLGNVDLRFYRCAGRPPAGGGGGRERGYYAINPSTELKNAAFRQGLPGCCEGTLLR